MKKNLIILFTALSLALPLYAAESEELNALQYNVWIRGTKVPGGLNLTVDTIESTEADIVCLVEIADLNLKFVDKVRKRLAKRDLVFYGETLKSPEGLVADTAIISRHPVLEETLVYRDRDNCIVRSLIDVNGETIAVYGVHLEYKFYSCYLPRGYSSDGELFPGWKLMDADGDGVPDPVTDLSLIAQDNIASGRKAAMEKLVADAARFRTEGISVIVMGDFNEPSALDWTEETAELFDRNGVVYPWDTSVLLLDEGFKDSYRELYPDPSSHPGFTWPAAAQGKRGPQKNTTWTPLADERERIDFIYYRGTGLIPRSSTLVGTPETIVRNRFRDESEEFQDLFTLETGAPWSSDHRAVMTRFKLRETGAE